RHASRVRDGRPVRGCNSARGVRRASDLAVDAVEDVEAPRGGRVRDTEVVAVRLVVGPCDRVAPTVEPQRDQSTRAGRAATGEVDLGLVGQDGVVAGIGDADGDRLLDL